MKKILISDISSYKGIVIAKFLKKTYEIDIMTCDSRDFTDRWHTKYSDRHVVLNHKVSDGLAYVDELNDIIKINEIDLYIPCNNKEMDLLLRYSDKIENAFDYWGSYESFETLNKKNKLQAFAKELGMRVPITYSSVENAKVPCVVKPTNESSSKGVVYLFSEEEKIKYLASSPNTENLIIQEYVEGVGAGYSVYAERGEILSGYGHKRLAEFPISGGSSVFRSQLENDEMKDCAARIVKALNWSGFAMFEFKLSANGLAYLIEVNPRIWGSINQGLQNGCNYFSPLLEKKSNDKKNTKSQTLTVLSPLIYISLLKYVMRGNLKPVLSYFKSCFNIRVDVNFWTDFRGYISILLLAKDKYEKNKRN